jgi:hypothetical protein
MKLATSAAAACTTIIALHGSVSAQGTTPVPDYTVDAAQGPLTGSTRVIGLGGAFVAIAEDMDGVAVNPASVAVRLPYSYNRLDYGFGVHFAIGSWLPGTDFLNQRGGSQESQNGQPAPEVEQRSLLFGSVGATLYYDFAGVGIAAEGQRQALHRSANTSAGLSPTSLSGNFGIVHASVAYGFWEGQFVVGAGPRVTGVSFSRAASSDLLNVAGVGYQAGLVFKPLDHQFRVGAAYKSAVTPALGSGAQGDDPNVYDATAIRLPWQASAGFAYQFGARRLNPRVFFAEDQTARLGYELEQKEKRRRRERELFERAAEREPSPESRRRLAEIEKAHAAEKKADEKLAAERLEQAEDALLAEYRSRSRFYVLLTTELLALGASSGSVGFG